MIDFTEYIGISIFSDFSTPWWEVKMIKFTEYIVFFRLFNLLLGGQTDRFYWIYLIFSLFRLFELMLGVQIDWYYWMYWIFSTFRLFELLVGGQNDWFYWIYRFFLIFDFSTSWREVKMIKFTECIDFFRFFYLMLGGQTDRFYWIYWILFDFSTFRPLAGRSKWLILQNILDFLDFSTFRPLVGRSKWSILLNILIFLT